MTGCHASNFPQDSLHLFHIINASLSTGPPLSAHKHALYLLTVLGGRRYREVARPRSPRPPGSSPGWHHHLQCLPQSIKHWTKLLVDPSKHPASLSPEVEISSPFPEVRIIFVARHWFPRKYGETGFVTDLKVWVRGRAVLGLRARFFKKRCEISQIKIWR